MASICEGESRRPTILKRREPQPRRDQGALEAKDEERINKVSHEAKLAASSPQVYDRQARTYIPQRRP